MWRCSRTALAAGWVAFVCLAATGTVLVVAAIANVATGDWGLGAGLIAGAAGAVGVAVVVWRAAIRPRVVLGDTGVEVVNPWTRRMLAWSDVLWADPGYSGVTISSRSGRSVTAWAVQKSNFSTWTKRTTRADHLVKAIRTRIHQIA